MKHIRNLNFKRIMMIAIPFGVLMLLIFFPGSKKEDVTPDDSSFFNVSEGDDNIGSNSNQNDNTAFRPNNYSGGYIPTSTIGEKNKDTLRSKMPIHRNFETSVGETTINIYSVFGDTRSTIHIEIYGINYRGRETDPNNYNVVAFRESLAEVDSMLKNLGVDIRNMNIIYGTNKYMHDTATFWIDFFHLL